MAIDAYVKFGETTDPSPDGESTLPDIEGDSSDSMHWYWCELRECGFDMTAPQEEDEKDDDSQGNGSPGGNPDQSDADDNKSSFAPVTLRKRVDWASTILFGMCCEASLATMPNQDPNDGTGVIDQVTVEIMRPALSADGKKDKIPCVRVRYYSVRITKYAVALSGPEPAETITFEFDDVDFTYLQTDPYTNRVIKEAVTDKLKNHHKKSHEAAGDSGLPGASVVAPVAATVAGVPGGGAAGGASGNGNTPPPPLGAPNGTGAMSFPGGIWQTTGPPNTEN